MYRTKVCRRCTRRRPLRYYHKDKRNRDGRASYCKKCSLQYDRAFHRENPDYRKLYMRAYRKKN